jgi:hypothetical protein
MSQGTPTALVRDGGIVGQDPVSDEAFTVTPVRLGDGIGSTQGADLRRADDVEREDPFDPAKAVRRAWDVIDQASTWRRLPGPRAD